MAIDFCPAPGFQMDICLAMLIQAIILIGNNHASFKLEGETAILDVSNVSPELLIPPTKAIDDLEGTSFAGIENEGVSDREDK